MRSNVVSAPRRRSRARLARQEARVRRRVARPADAANARRRPSQVDVRRRRSAPNAPNQDSSTIGARAGAERRRVGSTRGAALTAPRCACSYAARCASPQKTPPRPGQRLVARQVHAAVRAGQHRLRRLAGAASRRRRAAAARPRRCRAAARAARRTSDQEEQRYFIGSAQPAARCSTHLEHEARADIGQQQQRGAGIEPARRACGRASRTRGGRRAGRRTRPAEHREHRLVVPAPVLGEPEPSTIAADSTTKPASTKRKVSRSRRSSGMPCAPARRRRSGAAPHLPLGAVRAAACSTATPNRPYDAMPSSQCSGAHGDAACGCTSPGNSQREHDDDDAAAARARGARRAAARSRLSSCVDREHQPQRHRQRRREAEARAGTRRAEPAMSIDERHAVRDPADAAARRARPPTQPLARQRRGERSTTQGQRRSATSAPAPAARRPARVGTER